MLHLNMCVLLDWTVAVQASQLADFFFRSFNDALIVSIQLFRNCDPRKPPGIPQSEYKGSATKKMPLQYEEQIN